MLANFLLLDNRLLLPLGPKGLLDWHLLLSLLLNGLLSLLWHIKVVVVAGVLSLPWLLLLLLESSNRLLLDVD